MEPRPYLQEIQLRREQAPNFKEYPFNIAAVRTLDVMTFHRDITFLIGENGVGKSTLIEAIALAMGFGPEGGTRNVRKATAQTTSELFQHLRIVKSYMAPKDYYFLRAESFYNVATYMDEIGALEGYGGKSLHARSHGEAFMAALTMKLRRHGFYIFDEPEAALSPTRQMAALAAIHELVKRESQFIIATHSPILLAYPGARILRLDENGITEQQYEDTEHYSVTRNFLNHYRHSIRHLLGDEETW